jgi:hypothetical protein
MDVKIKANFFGGYLHSIRSGDNLKSLIKEKGCSQTGMEAQSLFVEMIIMAWQKVFNLLWEVKGKIEAIDPEKLKEAAQDGPGSPDVQRRIAVAEYKRFHRREFKNDPTIFD